MPQWNRPPGVLLPFGLVEELLQRGHSLDEVRGMSLEQAQRLARDMDSDAGEPAR